jgi:hypothetical protein
MGKAHQNRKKKAQPKNETEALAINRKQTPSIQSSTKTHMDLWNSAMGYNLQFQHRNHPALLIQESRLILNAPWYINNHNTDPNKKVEYQILQKIRKPHQCTSNKPTRQYDTTTHRQKNATS